MQDWLFLLSLWGETIASQGITESRICGIREMLERLKRVLCRLREALRALLCREKRSIMKLHNQSILNFLDDYLGIDKPKYAVLIKGEWGSGKTYFINQWRSRLEGCKDGWGNQKYTPIYISLYGLNKCSLIDDAIRAQLNPLLYGDIAKKIGKAINIASSIAFRTKLDFGGENLEGSVTCTIDPKAFFQSATPNIKGKRFLIFDDIERCGIEINDLMGYINFFVEQAECHVVIVGDENNVEESEELKIIKEKTIGREFEIEPEDDDALRSFFQEISEIYKLELTQYAPMAQRCFRASKRKNLRIIRQALIDFCLFQKRLPKDIIQHKNFEHLRQCLLANFIVVYVEYKSDNDTLDNWTEKLTAEQMRGLLRTEGNGKESSPALDTLAKYRDLNLDVEFQVLNPAYMECVMLYMQKGGIDETLLLMELNKDRKTPWEALIHFDALSNEELSKNIEETRKELTKGHLINKEEKLISIVFALMRVIKEGLTSLYNMGWVQSECIRIFKNVFLSNCQNQEDLRQLWERMLTLRRYYGNYKIQDELDACWNKIFEEINEKESSLPNSLTQLINGISDDNLSQVLATYGGPLPDKSRPYSGSSIFENVDAEQFVQGFITLNNKNKSEFVAFIRSHYTEVRENLAIPEYTTIYAGDLKGLPQIISQLDQQIEKFELVDKYNIQLLRDELQKGYDLISKAQNKKQTE